MSKLATFVPLLGLLLFASGPAGAQTDYSEVEIKTTELGHRTFMLEGAGGNITVAVGEGGIIMVDGQFAPLHDKIKAAIAAVSKEPIRYLVNTHFHGDHAGGNEGFAKDGAVVTAHENVAKRLSAGTTNGLTGATTPPAPEGAVPTKTYTTEMTLQVGGREAVLKHLDNAHTDGDTYVYFPDANVLSRSPKVLQQLSEPEVFGGHAGLATCLLRRQRQNPGRGSGGQGIGNARSMVEKAIGLGASSTWLLTPTPVKSSPRS